MHCVKNATHKIRTDQGLIFVQKRNRFWAEEGNKFASLEFTVLDSTDDRVSYGDTIAMRDGVMRIVSSARDGANGVKRPEWRLRSLYNQVD